MTRYFISDLHLSNKRLDLIQAFVRLCKELNARNENAELYILGDFYDAWIGDDFQADWNDTIEESLIHLTQIRVFFIHGNRDFLIGKEWCQRTHVTQLASQSIILNDQQSVLLCHGDEFCTDDHNYQAFRSMVRSDQWQQQILALPITQRIELAAKLRADSQSSSSEKSMAIMDVNPISVKEDMHRHDCRYLIHGHTHRPFVHQGDRTRIVLGDWDDNIWLASLNGQHFTQYSAKTEDFVLEGMSALSLKHDLVLD
ncbi:UDP-2,3-diacylglucosamine diphosphatase [Marinomonas epiphytica]